MLFFRRIIYVILIFFSFFLSSTFLSFQFHHFFKLLTLLHSFSPTFREMSPNFDWFSLSVMRELIVCFQWKKKNVHQRLLLLCSMCWLIEETKRTQFNNENTTQSNRQMISFGWLLSMEWFKRITQRKSFGWWSWLSFIPFFPTMIHFHSTVWSTYDLSLIQLIQTMNTIDGCLNVMVARRSSFLFVVVKILTMERLFWKTFLFPVILFQNKTNGFEWLFGVCVVVIWPLKLCGSRPFNP